MVLRGFLAASLSLIFFIFFFHSSPPSFYYTTFLSLLLSGGGSIEPLFPFVTLVPSPPGPCPSTLLRTFAAKSINGSTGPRPWRAVDRSKCGVQFATWRAKSNQG